MTLRNPRIFAIFLLGLPALASSPSTPGIENFHQIDHQVYRGAQPTDEGIHYLSTIGVKVVIDLREHDQRAVDEERTVTAAGMRYVNVPMTGMTSPSTAETDKLLALLEDPAAGPVFVHCKRGADRTGAVIAAYRIDHDKWDNAQALNEAMSDHMSSLQFQRQKYIRTFQGRPTDATSADVVAPAAATNVKD
jgi:protein tyrosine/serine phosphatase